MYLYVLAFIIIINAVYATYADAFVIRVLCFVSIIVMNFLVYICVHTRKVYIIFRCMYVYVSMYACKYLCVYMPTITFI